MKTSLIALVVMAVVASAADLSSLIDSLPKCAQGCFSDGLPKDCGTDTSCICKTASFVHAATCCVQSKCNSSDASSVLSLAEKLCPNITKASTCAATSGTATATATGSAASAASGTATASPDDLDDDPTGTSLPDATGGVTQNSARITAAPNVNAMALLGAAAVYLI